MKLPTASLNFLSRRFCTARLPHETVPQCCPMKTNTGPGGRAYTPVESVHGVLRLICVYLGAPLPNAAGVRRCHQHAGALSSRRVNVRGTHVCWNGALVLFTPQPRLWLYEACRQASCRASKALNRALEQGLLFCRALLDHCA